MCFGFILSSLNIFSNNFMSSYFFYVFFDDEVKAYF